MSFVDAVKPSVDNGRKLNTFDAVVPSGGCRKCGTKMDGMMEPIRFWTS
jgi:hypothetical protein